MTRAIKFVFACAGIPVIWATMRAFLQTISIFRPLSSDHTYFVAGLLAYPVFQVLFAQPLRTYVFGHELTHALASLLMGGRIKRFKVSKSGGSVRLSKTNFLVSLAPYFAPLYTILLIGTYFVAGIFCPVARYHNIFLFCVGFSLSFHFALTVFAIKQRQPDITKTGVFFSMTIILILTPWAWVAVLKIIFYTQISMSAFFNATCRYTADAYGLMYTSLVHLIQNQQ